MFSVPHTTPVSLDWCFKKPRAEKSRDYHDVIVFEKLRFRMFSVHTKTKSQPRFSNSSGLKSVFEKLPVLENKIRPNISVFDLKLQTLITLTQIIQCKRSIVIYASVRFYLQKLLNQRLFKQSSQRRYYIARQLKSSLQ